MDSTLEKKQRERALELGNSGRPSALPELIELTRSPAANVRRLAASAIGKLAGLTDGALAVSALGPMLRDAKPQVRQYAARALSAHGSKAKTALHDLRDMAISPVEKVYNNNGAKRAIGIIEEASRIEKRQAMHCCQRCGVELESDEFSRSQKAFQRPFCNYCYDERFRILDGYAIRPDFYLPEFDVYIEYWGMDTADYKIGMLKKQKLYQQQGKRLISLYPDDKPSLHRILLIKLEKAGYNTPS